MSDEYIKRDTAYNYLTEYYNHRTDNQHQNLRKALNAIPSADVAEVKRGEWRTVDIFSEKGYGERYYQHRECSTELYKSPYNFCPNCGSDMRGGT